MQGIEHLNISISLLVGEYRDRIDSIHRKDEKSNKVFLAISILLLAFYAAIFSSATDKLSFSYEYSTVVYIVLFALWALHLLISVFFYLSFFQSINLVDSARLLDMCTFVEKHLGLEADLFLFSVADKLSNVVTGLDDAIKKKNKSLNHLFCMAKHLTFFTLVTLFFLFFVKFYGLYMNENLEQCDKQKRTSSESAVRKEEAKPTIRERLRDVAPEALDAENQVTLEGYASNNKVKSILKG